MIHLDSKSTNPAAPAFNQKPDFARKKDRFAFPVSRKAFETFAFSPSCDLFTRYTKTLSVNLQNGTSDPEIPTIANPTSKLWEIKKPLRSVTNPVKNDFYFNPMDIYNDTLLIATDNKVFGYCSAKLNQKFLIESEPDTGFQSIKSHSKAPVVAIRTHHHILKFLDIEKKCMVSEQNLAKISGVDPVISEDIRIIRGSSITWRNPFEVTTPLLNRCLHYDHRNSKPIKFTLGSLMPSSYEKIIYGVAWNSKGNLLATGDYDGEVQVYDIRNTGTSLLSYNHQWAIKVLSWHPSANILASGGGSADRILRITDITDNTLILNLYTGAQICSLAWLNRQHLLTGSGFRNNNINLQVYKVDNSNTVAIPHPQHSSTHPNRILAVVKDPKVDKRYYTLSTSDIEGQICQWGLPEKDPSRAKDLLESFR